MTTSQIKWAGTHDWYVDKSADGDAVLVREILPDHTIEYTWFVDFKELRAWAGY